MPWRRNSLTSRVSSSFLVPRCHHLTAFGLCTPLHSPFFASLQPCYSCTLEQRWRLLQKVFSDEVGAKLVAYHAHECLVQLLPGLIPVDVMRKKISCLVVLSWLIDSEKAKPPFLDLVASHGGGMAVASADSEPKGARVWQDMEACGAVFERLRQDVASKGLGRASNNEEAFVPVLAVMQSQGLGFSPAVLLRHKTDMV